MPTVPLLPPSRMTVTVSVPPASSTVYPAAAIDNVPEGLEEELLLREEEDELELEDDSLSAIVTVAVSGEPMLARFETEMILTVNVSFDSEELSSTISIDMVLLVCPSSNVTSPDG